MQEEQLREHYFLATRMGLLLLLEIYSTLSQSLLTGTPLGVLLLLALFIGAVAGKELVGPVLKLVLFLGAVVIFGIMTYLLGNVFLLLGIFLCYEALTCLKAGKYWYLLPVLLSLLFYRQEAWEQMILAILLGLFYFQHNFIIEYYRLQMKEDTLTEESLKHRINRKNREMEEEVKKSFLLAENQILEEREQLSQTLHDKLGHSINGSVYQLEAVKLILEKDPKKSKEMIQKVINQLRSGMDEIRGILRRERPEKYRLALLQLEKLCEDCRITGVEAELLIEGELSQIPQKHLEVILDNSYEAISNSMKYAGCTRITIRIHVLNQVIRCSIWDNGRGCPEIVDGMGISGMRRRMREVNGILNFESENGFMINMLLPLPEGERQGNQGGEN